MIKDKPPQPLRGSVNGSTPFFRMALGLLCGIILSFVSVVPIDRGWILHKPNTIETNQDIGVWFVSSMVVPCFVVYVMSSVISVYILSQSSLSYTAWVVKESIMHLLVGFLTSLAFVVSVLALLSWSSYVDDFTIRSSTGTSIISEKIWLLSLFVPIFVAWMGYRVAWKSYRVVGAQTMQMRYEADLQRMEVKNSGRWWDKWVDIRIRSLTGADGSKPRMFVVYFFLSFFTVTLVYSIYQVSQVSIIIGALFFVVYPGWILFYAACSKWRDGRYASKHLPYLVPVRGKDTVDSYNPESKGSRKLVGY